MNKIGLVIPTLNACSQFWKDVLQAIASQELQLHKKLVIDTSSTDETVAMAKEFGFDICNVSRSDFNHGLTRQRAVDILEGCDIVIFMTQDCILNTKSSLTNLIKSFDDDTVGVAYGRQLSRTSSSLLERQSRVFNYPEESRKKSKEDIKELGLNTPFCSDSFSAYRVSSLRAIGGFPKTEFGEDMLVAAKVILNDQKIAYVAEAEVIHSHTYSWFGEYMRGKAIGKMHKENPWLLESFGGAEKRGSKMVFGAKFYQIPILIYEALPKLLGYRMGKRG